MKKRIEKRVCKFACLLLAALLFGNFACMEVRASEAPSRDVVEAVSMADEVDQLEASVIVSESDGEVLNPNARALLYNCIINMYCSSEGLRLTFVTECSQTASVIGVKDIVIQKKVWYGWKTVATSDGAEDTNNTALACSVLYPDAEVGETYRFSCIHYADADEYSEVVHQTDGAVFTY